MYSVQPRINKNKKTHTNVVNVKLYKVIPYFEIKKDGLTNKIPDKIHKFT